MVKIEGKDVHCEDCLRKKRGKGDCKNAHVMFGNIHDNLEKQRGQRDSRLEAKIRQDRENSNYCENDCPSCTQKVV